MRQLRSLKLVIALVAVLMFSTVAANEADPLPSWNDGKTKQSILDYVAKVTKEGSPDFVKPVERIAVFDNDGALWSEQPMYVQASFIFDGVKALSPQHPDGKDKEPFVSVLKGDLEGALASGAPVSSSVSTVTSARRQSSSGSTRSARR